MKYVFITGIPTAGKSYLAKKVSESLGISFVKIDDWRDEFRSDPELKKWVDFFWNKNEENYWQMTSPNQEWEDLKNQSEALWPAIFKKIEEIQRLGKPTIFEGVNILPHLAKRDLKFQGIVVLGESFDTILERNKQEPRWGRTDELIKKEAEAFWGWERPRYAEEAKKYDFKAFSDPIAAEKEIRILLDF
ncbi:MAG: hypothetical protein ABR884_02835 [Minisyncoccia bacterium]|jgi:hypothetical protein